MILSERQEQALWHQMRQVANVASVISGEPISPITGLVRANSIIKERHESLLPDVSSETLRRRVVEFDTDPSIVKTTGLAAYSLQKGNFSQSLQLANYLHAYTEVDVPSEEAQQAETVMQLSQNVHVLLANRIVKDYGFSRSYATVEGKELMKSAYADFANGDIRSGYKKVRCYVHSSVFYGAYPNAMQFFDPYAIGIRNPSGPKYIGI